MEDIACYDTREYEYDLDRDQRRDQAFNDPPDRRIYEFDGRLSEWNRDGTGLECAHCYLLLFEPKILRRTRVANDASPERLS